MVVTRDHRCNSLDKMESWSEIGVGAGIIRIINLCRTWIEGLEMRKREWVATSLFVGEGRKFSVNKVETQKMGGQQLITNGVVNFGGNSMVAGNPMAGGNPMVGGNSTIQNKINGATPPFLDHRRIEQKEKIQETENDEKRGDKRKHNDRDKQREGKDKKVGKEEKSKEKNEQKKAERDKNKRIKKSDPVTVPNSLPAQSLETLETSFQGVGTEGIHKKRKDMESNGVFHENDEKRGDKRKHNDRDKQREGKDKKDKKVGKEEKSKEKSEQKKAERDKNKRIKKSDPVTTMNRGRGQTRWLDISLIS
nr:hypothetical protein [Tanacetum cinerariifolium]